MIVLLVITALWNSDPSDRIMIEMDNLLQCMEQARQWQEIDGITARCILRQRRPPISPWLAAG
jgi:hypothetical protein